MAFHLGSSAPQVPSGLECPFHPQAAEEAQLRLPLRCVSSRERAAQEACSGIRPNARNTKIVGTNSRKSLKTKDGGYYKVQKRTQNELVFEHKMRESSCNSEVARRNGKKPLTRLASLATLCPRVSGWKPHSDCHSERSEESRSECFRGRARFLVAFGSSE